MDSTSINLLKRLRETSDEVAWERFVDLYAPLIFYWAKSHGLQASDAADLSQDVFATLVSKLPTFEYAPNLRFRGWLHTITLNRARDWQRRNARQVSTSNSAFVENIVSTETVDPFDEQEYRRLLVQRAKEVMEADFEPATWKACWLTVTEGLSAAEVARQTGLSENGVRVAKCRVLKRLREELDGLFDQF